MTLSEIREQIWMALGEPTDLKPDSTGETLLAWVVNEGQRQIASWKDPSTGRHLRIQALQSEMFYYLKNEEYTVDNVKSDFPYGLWFTNTTAYNDYYNGWLVKTGGGETALVMDYSGDSKYIHLSNWFNTAPEAGDTIYFYRNFQKLTGPNWDHDIQIPLSEDLIEVLSIIDLDQGRELKKAGPEKFPANLQSTGEPEYWWRFGDKIFYDVHVETEKWFKMEYYRMPDEMVLATDEPEIPSIYHYAIVLWGIWWGYKRNGESSRAYSTKRDLEDYMKRVKTQADVEFYRLEPGASVMYDWED